LTSYRSLEGAESELFGINRLKGGGSA